MAENRIEKLMRILKISEEEAKDILAKDKAIDQGERVEFDIDIEAEKAAKKLIKADRKKPSAPVKRTMKPKEDMRLLISAFASALQQIGCEYEIENVEHKINIFYNGQKYYINLSKTKK